MFDIAAQQVWLVPGATDMRKSIDGLSALAQYALGKNSLEPQRKRLVSEFLDTTPTRR